MISELTNEYILAKVLSITHYTNRLFSFKTVRPLKLTFKPGEFIMIGLIIRGEFIFRAYSICNAPWDKDLEFYSIKVINGPFTSFLQKITTDSSIIIKVRSTGTLLLKALKLGTRLFLLCTGTGIAPFASIIADTKTYERFAEIIIVLTCRSTNELQYFDAKLKQFSMTKTIKNFIKNKLRFYKSITREPFPYHGRIPTLIKSGLLVNDLKINNFNNMDRFMICGSQGMISDISNLLKSLGYKEGSSSCPQDFVYEKSFVN